jgi:hypothetical protein
VLLLAQAVHYECLGEASRHVFFFVGYKGGGIYWLAIHCNQANLIVGGLRHISLQFVDLRRHSTSQCILVMYTACSTGNDELQDRTACPGKWLGFEMRCYVIIIIIIMLPIKP